MRTTPVMPTTQVTAARRSGLITLLVLAAFVISTGSATAQRCADCDEEPPPCGMSTCEVS